MDNRIIGTMMRAVNALATFLPSARTQVVDLFRAVRQAAKPRTAHSSHHVHHTSGMKRIMRTHSRVTQPLECFCYRCQENRRAWRITQRIRKQMEKTA